MPEIQSLEPVSLREAWPHEAQDSTPWLANNIDSLGAALDPRLERVQKEVTLPRAGRVDICAQQAEPDARVVIENQFEESDDLHCLRLLGFQPPLRHPGEFAGNVNGAVWRDESRGNSKSTVLLEGDGPLDQLMRAEEADPDDAEGAD